MTSYKGFEIWQISFFTDVIGRVGLHGIRSELQWRVRRHWESVGRKEAEVGQVPGLRWQSGIGKQR